MSYGLLVSESGEAQQAVVSQSGEAQRAVVSRSGEAQRAVVYRIIGLWEEEHTMRTSARTLVSILLTGIALGFGYVIFVYQTTPRASNYRAAVVAVLMDAQVDFHAVDVINGCAPTYQSCRTYAGTVYVERGHTTIGQISCRERWTNCALTLSDAGIVDAPLPDTRDPLIWRFEQLRGQLILWMRGIR